MLEPTLKQAEIWAADNLGVEKTNYQVALLVEIVGDLSVAALEAALHDVIERHEILRTTIDARAGELRCEVLASNQFDLDVVADLQAVAGHLGIDADLVIRQADRTLNIATSLPIMARITSFGSSHYFLSVVVHHVAFDNWSANLFYRELEVRYGAHIRGCRSLSAPLPMQYAAYCANRDAATSENELESLQFWQSKLDGFEPFEIPPVRQRPQHRSGSGQSLSFDVPKETTSLLADLARDERSSVAMVLFAAVQAALARFCGTSDVNFGTVVADRGEEEAQEIIGPLLNTVVLSCDALGNPSFSQMVREMTNTMLDAITHGQVPFSELVRAHGATNDLSRNPLCQVMVQFLSEIRSAPRIEACQTTEVSVPTVSSKYDLSIFLQVAYHGGLSVSLGWDDDLYDAEMMSELGKVMLAVIEHVVREPATRLGSLPIMGQEAKSALLSAQVGEHVEHESVSIRRLVARQAVMRPAAVALIAHDGSVCTYDDLNRKAGIVARRLRSLSIRPEAIVAIYAGRGVEQVVAILGAMEAGVAYFALDPDYPLERSEFMLRDSKAEAMIVSSAVPVKLASCVKNTLVLHEMIRDPVDGEEIPIPSPQGMATLIYTSGSTGRPKGVMLTFGGLTKRIHDLQREITLTPDDRVLWKASSSFDMSIMEVLWPLCFGAKVVIARPRGQSDPAYLVELMRSHAVSVATFVPAVAAAIASEPDLGSCSDLRALVIGGDKVDVAVTKSIKIVLPRCSLFGVYGPTETTIATSWVRFSSEDLRDMDVAPLGSVLSNTRMIVLDNRLEPVPSGGVGELCIGGAGVARGYFARPDLTADRFVPDPFVTGERLYRTGDAVRFSALTSTFQFLGRLDSQVKIGGIRIELGEIENVLRRHAAVVDCASVLSKAGLEGNGRLVAFVTTNTFVETDELLSHARKFLPPSVCPSAVILLDEMPLTPNGKIDRPTLSGRVGSTVQAVITPGLNTEAPDAVQRIWCEVLGQTGPDLAADFFDSGGSSLLAMNLTGRVRGVLKKDVPFSLIFMYPTFGEFREQVFALESYDDGSIASPENFEISDGRGEGR